MDLVELEMVFLSIDLYELPPVLDYQSTTLLPFEQVVEDKIVAFSPCQRKKQRMIQETLNTCHLNEFDEISSCRKPSFANRSVFIPFTPVNCLEDKLNRFNVESKFWENKNGANAILRTRLMTG